jgi:plasmid stabilization system protein ParE
MADYFYSPAARLDLLEIWEYIARDNLDAADRVERKIEQAIMGLADNPDLGHWRRDLTSKPVRFWPVYSYLIIYDPNTQPLEIVRILSGYRDIAELLKQ